MGEAGIRAPRGVDGVGIGGIGNGESVLQHIDVGGGESDLDLARAVGAGRVEHHVAVALLLGVVRPLSFILRAGRGCHNGGKDQGAKFCCVEMLHNGSVIVYGCKVTQIDAIRG